MKGALALRGPTGVPISNINGSVTIPSASYLQLSASLGYNCSAIQVSNTGAKPVKLAIGGAGAEVDQVIVAPGSLGELIPLNIKKGARLAAKAVDADITTGYLTIDFLG